MEHYTRVPEERINWLILSKRFWKSIWKRTECPNMAHCCLDRLHGFGSLLWIAGHILSKMLAVHKIHDNSPFIFISEEIMNLWDAKNVSICLIVCKKLGLKFAG